MSPLAELEEVGQLAGWGDACDPRVASVLGMLDACGRSELRQLADILALLVGSGGKGGVETTVSGGGPSYDFSKPLPFVTSSRASLRNTNHDLRCEVPNPTAQVSIWNASTINPECTRMGLRGLH